MVLILFWIVNLTFVEKLFYVILSAWLDAFDKAWPYLGTGPVNIILLHYVPKIKNLFFFFLKFTFCEMKILIANIDCINDILFQQVFASDYIPIYIMAYSINMFLIRS